MSLYRRAITARPAARHTCRQLFASTTVSHRMRRQRVLIIGDLERAALPVTVPLAWWAGVPDDLARYACPADQTGAGRCGERDGDSAALR